MLIKTDAILASLDITSRIWQLFLEMVKLKIHKITRNNESICQTMLRQVITFHSMIFGNLVIQRKYFDLWQSPWKYNKVKQNVIILRNWLIQWDINWHKPTYTRATQWLFGISQYAEISCAKLIHGKNSLLPATNYFWW